MDLSLNKDKILQRMENFLENEQFSDVNFSKDRIYTKKIKIHDIKVYDPKYIHPHYGRVKFQDIPINTENLWKTTKIGSTFGPTQSTYWFRVNIFVPKEWDGEEVHFLWNSCSEAMIYSKNGDCLQGLTGGDGDGSRTEFVITKKYVYTDKYLTLYIEMACNELFGAGSYLIGSPNKNKYFELKCVEIAIFDREAQNLRINLKIIFDLAHQFKDDPILSLKFLKVSNDIINNIDLENKETQKSALNRLNLLLNSQNKNNDHTIYAIGHCHIDTGWLQPYAETRRKVIRSWATQLNYIEKYPFYKFIASQAQQYEWLKQDNFKLFNRIKDNILCSNGGFKFIGGSQVEMDTNIPSGESLVRQFLLGQKFFKSEFGMYSNVFQLPDTFGYSAQLPQLLNSANMKYFLTQKLSQNDTNKFNMHSFKQKGIDGSFVITHFIPSNTYNSDGSIKDIMLGYENYMQKDVSNESLLVYGIGDGGGGPKPIMIEQLKICKNINYIPNIKFDFPINFFKKLESHNKELPVYIGELYFENHRGTFTSQSVIKALNRYCEQTMKKMELFALICFRLYNAKYPSKEIMQCWKNICLNQFHDVIPGTSIADVYSDARKLYKYVQDTSLKLLNEFYITTLTKFSTLDLRSGINLKNNIFVFNSLSFKRKEIIELSFQYYDKNIRYYQKTIDGSFLYIVETCSMGYSFFDKMYIKSIDKIPVSIKICKCEKQNELSICIVENYYLKLEIYKNGRIKNIFDKENVRNIVPKENFGNIFSLYNDVPLFQDAQNVEAYYIGTKKILPGATEMNIIEVGPVLATIEFIFHISKYSKISQYVSMTCLSKLIYFKCKIDQHENRKFLRVEYPINILSDNANYEIAYGHLNRSTTQNTSYEQAKFEVSFHKQMDISEFGYGVALINESKYGGCIKNNVISLSLLRSPKSPDENCDMGHHVINYCIFPHIGCLQSSNVIQTAYSFNSKLDIVETNDSIDNIPDFTSYFSLDIESVFIDTVKKAEDDNGIVIRLYEAFGGRTCCKLLFHKNFNIKEAFICNILEDKKKALKINGSSIDLYFSPFKILTIKLVS